MPLEHNVDGTDASLTEAGAVHVALRGLVAVIVAAALVFVVLDGHARGCRRQQSASVPLEHNVVGTHASLTEAGAVHVALRGPVAVFVAVISGPLVVSVVIDGHARGCRRQQAASMPLEHNVAGAWRACFCAGTAAIVVVQLPPPLRLIAETALLLACAPTLAANSDRARSRLS